MIGIRRYYLLSLIVILLTMVNCSVNQEKLESDRKCTFSILSENFPDPPVEYRSAPLFVFHDQVSKKEIEFHLKKLKEQGFGGVFIHPRYGLITEYLSDEWFDLVKFTVEKAKSMGMQAWIYDENSFPSGFAGGHVPAEMPESYNQGQGLIPEKTNILPNNTEKFFLILKKDGDSFIKVTDSKKYLNKQGEYYLYKKEYYNKGKWYGGYSYVDLLVPGVTEKFIEVTMQGYEKAVGEEFGKTVPGVFTDEPNIKPPSPPKGKSIMRWTPDLFEAFEKRWGYDLGVNLPSLFEETGDWKRIRHNYYQLLLQMFIDRWSKPWHEYTEENDLKWTGHYWEHGWPDPHHGGDNMAMYAWHQIPAIDMLFNQMDDDKPIQFGNVRAVKELRSVANQTGSKRTLSETYGGAGWELSLQDMKRLGDWEYVLGVNFMNQHLTYMTLAGDRKHDFPQSFSYHAPWWNNYKPLADHFARLSMALSSGEQLNTTLILEPTTTAWMYFSWTKSPQNLWDIDDKFRALLNDLEKYHIEYDLGCENIIKDRATINNGKFVIGKRDYNLIVIPDGFESFDIATVSLIEEYLKQGGKIISFAGIPQYIDGVKTNKITNIANQFKSQWIEAESIHNKKVSELLYSKNFNMLDADKIGGKLFHQRRQFDDGQLLFMVNSSTTEESKGKFHIDGSSVSELNTLTGEITDYPAQKVGDQVMVSFELPPVGSILLFISKEHKKNNLVQSGSLSQKILKPIDKPQVERISPNVLTLDYCDLILGNKTEKGLYYYYAANKIWQHHGFEANPWVSSVQYKTNILDKSKFSDDSGFDVIYHFQVGAKTDRSSLQAVIERPELWKVKINDHLIESNKGEWWLDRTFGVFNIGKYVKTGDNQIQLITHPMSIHAELEPIYILGDFNLKSSTHGWEIFPQRQSDLGEWSNQGMPFYHDGVSYTKNYDFKSFSQTAIVRLNEWLGSVASVEVNGNDAGIIGWPPYQLDITDHVIEGKNEISVIVYGSLKNVLGPHHNVNSKGLVTPWSFKYAPEVQPSGNKYDNFEYGLFNDFDVLIRE